MGLAAKEPEELLPDSSLSANPDSNPGKGPLRPSELPKRSPELRAKIEKIGQIEHYAVTDRDTTLFSCLNDWRDLRICGRVLTYDRLGLSKAFEIYLKDKVKRRSGLLQVPAPIAYVEIEQNGSATDLFLSILEFLSNPIDCGILRDLRSRAWGTLKAYGVKILIVNNADLLSFKAFNELVRISEKLNIPVIIAGQSYLEDIIEADDKSRKKYTNIYNTFLRKHTFSSMSQGVVKLNTESWETEFNKSLKEKQPLELSKDPEILKVLHKYSQGQLRPLFEALREVAVWKLDHPKAQVNDKNLENLLETNFQPLPQLIPSSGHIGADR